MRLQTETGLTVGNGPTVEFVRRSTKREGLLTPAAESGTDVRIEKRGGDEWTEG